MEKLAPGSVTKVENRRLDLNTTGVLLFDFVNYTKRPPVSRPSVQVEKSRHAIANAVRIAQAARQRNIPLLYTAPDHRPDGRDTPARLLDRSYEGPLADPEAFHVVLSYGLRGQWESQIVEELAPQPEDTIVLKHRWSAFHQTHLELALRMLKVDTIAIMGGALEVGIASTAYSARDHDVNMIFIRDAITSGDPMTERAFMQDVLPRLGLVRTTDWFLEKLRSWEK